MPLSTILLDLDDTLLTTRTDAFVPAYIQRFTAFTTNFAPPEQISRILIQATRAVQANTDPARSNEAIFYDHFLPHFTAEEIPQLQARITAFYSESYPHLQAVVEPRPAARTLVETLFAQGYQVAIATNPFFPETAVQQRLAWANVADFPYALITTLENMHATKPHLAYYREILTRLDCQAEDCLMVGDDPLNDIAPANRLNIPTWWITDLADAADPNVSSTYRGTLVDFLNWITQNGGKSV